MSNLPDLEAWAIFSRVADCGSFARAAAELGLSTATVSKAVARLEQRIGASLLSRTSHRLALTTLGQEVAGRALRLLADAETIEAEMLDRTAQPRGLVRMAVPMSFGQQQVAPLLPALFERFPEILVDMHLSDEVVDLVAGGFDFAIRIARLENSSLRARRICDVRKLLVASPAYVQKHGAPMHPRDLQDHACFGYAYLPTANRWTFVGPDDELVTVQLSGPLRVNNGEALLPALLARHRSCGTAGLPGLARVADRVACRTDAGVVLAGLAAQPADAPGRTPADPGDRDHGLPAPGAFAGAMGDDADLTNAGAVSAPARSAHEPLRPRRRP